MQHLIVFFSCWALSSGTVFSPGCILKSPQCLGPTPGDSDIIDWGLGGSIFKKRPRWVFPGSGVRYWDPRSAVTLVRGQHRCSRSCGASWPFPVVPHVGSGGPVCVPGRWPQELTVSTPQHTADAPCYPGLAEHLGGRCLTSFMRSFFVVFFFFLISSRGS